MKNSNYQGATLLLLLAALALFLAACKREPDLPADPHVPLVNPFIGVWKETETRYWEFRPDGTGGRAATQAGPFPDEFSFLFFNGKGTYTRAEPSLAILEDSPAGVTWYEFTIAGNRATLSESSIDYDDPYHSKILLSTMTLEKISGSPQVISLKNPLIGEWLTDWDGTHNEGGSTIWSLKYYADGTVKTYHHRTGHQFENAYALRGNTLVIFGTLRFSFVPVIGEISQREDGKWQLTETQSYPPPANWVYTKVAAAEWL